LLLLLLLLLLPLLFLLLLLLVEAVVGFGVLPLALATTGAGLCFFAVILALWEGAARFLGLVKATFVSLVGS
jgi:hypothetical protein